MFSARYGNMRLALVGTFVIQIEGPTVYFLDPGVVQRDVFLPSITPDAGQLYLIANLGMSNRLRVLDHEGIFQALLEPDNSAFFVSYVTGWIVVTGGGGGGAGGIVDLQVPVPTQITSASVLAGGTSGTNGPGVVTVVGGTFTTPAQLNVTVAGGALSSVDSVADVGVYTAVPASPAPVSGLGLVGAMVRIVSAFETTFAADVTSLILEPAGPLDWGTILMPAAPTVSRVDIRSTEPIASLTMTPNVGQSVVAAPRTLAAGQRIDAIFVEPTWYFG